MKLRPLADRVILWTRVTLPQYPPQGVQVRWIVSSTADMQNVVRQGTQRVVATHDYTLKVDAQGLQPATTYYYQFITGPHKSIVGRTRTAPAADAQNGHFSLAFAACQQYEQGWYSAYRDMAARDLDLVVHAQGLRQLGHRRRRGPACIASRVSRPNRCSISGVSCSHRNRQAQTQQGGESGLQHTELHHMPQVGILP